MEDKDVTFSIKLNARKFEKSAIKECIIQDREVEGMYSLQKRPFIKQVPLWIKYYWKWYIVKPIKRLWK